MLKHADMKIFFSSIDSKCSCQWLMCLLLAAFVFSSSQALAEAQTLNKGQMITALSDLKKDYKNQPLKLKILDGFIFYTDTHYRGGSNKKFLFQASKLMAKREARDPVNMNPVLEKYFSDLAQVFENTKDNSTSAMVILKSYFKYSPIQNPRSPTKFITEADYSNGRDFYNIQ